MPDLATQVQKIPKKKQHQAAATSSSGSQAQFLPGPKLGESSSLPSLPFTGRQHIMAGYMQQHRLSMGPGQTSLQAQIQGQDSLISSLIPSRRVSATGSACAEATSVQGCSNNEVLDGTFGRVWHLLDDPHDDDHIQPNPLPPCSAGGIGNAAIFADLEPLPFSTELTVAEKWNHNAQQFPSSLFNPQPQFS